jgi:hypothetical protein
MSIPCTPENYPGLLDMLGMSLEEFAEADDVLGKIEEAKLAMLPAGIADPALRHALARDEAELLRLQREVELGVFCTTPAEIEDHGRALVQRALEAGSGSIRRLRAAKAGKARGAKQKAENAERDQWLREQRETITEGDALNVLQRRLRKEVARQKRDREQAIQQKREPGQVFRLVGLRRLRDIVEPKSKK